MHDGQRPKRLSKVGESVAENAFRYLYQFGAVAASEDFQGPGLAAPRSQPEERPSRDVLFHLDRPAKRYIKISLKRDISGDQPPDLSPVQSPKSSRAVKTQTLSSSCTPVQKVDAHYFEWIRKGTRVTDSDSIPLRVAATLIGT